MEGRQKVKFLGEGDFVMEAATPSQYTTGTIIEVDSSVAAELLERVLGGKKQWEPAVAENQAAPRQVPDPQAEDKQ